MLQTRIKIKYMLSETCNPKGVFLQHLPEFVSSFRKKNE